MAAITGKVLCWGVTSEMIFLLVAWTVVLPCVLCGRENVAPGRLCRISGEVSGYSASNAANNDTGHDYSSSNCIVTNHTNPYWLVNLTQTYDINQITIFGISTGANATDLLDNAEIRVSGILCYTFEASVNSSDLVRSITCNTPLKGSDVRVSRPSAGLEPVALGFCEVQVWVCSDGTYGTGCNEQCGHCKTGNTCDKTTGVCPTGCAPGYDPSADNKCKTECTNGKYGQDCSGTCSSFCSSSPCNKVNGQCTCKPGYKPPTCHQACDNGKYGQNCGQMCGHCAGAAVCNKVTGVCSGCAPGYDPSDKTCKRVCANGKYGQDCSLSCSTFCTSTCNKVNGHCTCQPGYQPSTCHQACTDGRWGQNCRTTCGQFCQDGVVCDKASGSCPCKTGYQTPRCTIKCAPRKYGQNCARTCGFCNNNEVCDHVTGNCTRCVDNREMPLCQDCLPGHWGPTCGQLCGQCGGNGRCDPVTGVCQSQVCLNGWTSAQCDQKCPAGWYGANCSLACGRCRGNSACRHDSGVCELECEDGYEGVLCTHEKQSLVGPIVGSVMGAAILIAVAIVAAMFYMKRSSKEKPSPLSKDFTTMAETAPVRQDSCTSARESRIYQNVEGGSSESSHLNPAFNYDHVDMARSDVHAYEGHAPDRAAAVAADRAVYQNTGALPSTEAETKAGRKRNRKENTYGNIVGASEATYGNVS